LAVAGDHAAQPGGVRRRAVQELHRSEEQGRLPLRLGQTGQEAQHVAVVGDRGGEPRVQG
jgi:hypothetical protein